jgi:glycosyltransferase involved in cell wall biosynthesis
MKQLKVCHICAALVGATWMIEQLRELRDRFGYDVYAIVITEDCDFARRLRAAGIKCIPFDFCYRTLKDMALLPLTIYRTARLFRRERFDVVQTHLFGAMIVGRVAGWLADVPVRLAMIASPFHLEAHTSRYVDQATVWMETGVIASCEKTVKLYKEIGTAPKKISLIYYGPDERKFDPKEIPAVDLRAELGWSEDTPIISLVAYFYPELPKSRWIPKIAFDRAIKGHEDFIEAAQIVLREFPEAKFLFVGGGFGEEGEKYRQKIIALVNSLGLEEKIIFTGHRTDVNGILLSVNVAVQAPILENLGGTVEALLMQRPLVATRVGGIPDSVRDGETGILVSPADAEDLARGILLMLRRPQEAERMAQNGRRLMLERFTLSRTASDLHELYQKQLGKKRRRGYSLLVSSYRQLMALPVYA